VSETPRAALGSLTNQLEGKQVEIGVALLAAIFVGCGGGSSAGVPRTPHAARTPQQDEQKGDREEATERRSAAPPPSPADRCTDGTCFPCGNGYCPNGFYCDLGTKGGAACSWLPACAKDASCTCVTRAFGSCTCATEGGGAHLSCAKN
jgi:hypothetical protein